MRQIDGMRAFREPPKSGDTTELRALVAEMAEAIAELQRSAIETTATLHERGMVRTQDGKILRRRHNDRE